MIYLSIYLAANIIPAWWFVANLGEKGNPTVFKQICNMGCIFFIEPACFPLVFGLGSFFWILLFGSAVKSWFENMKRTARRLATDEHAMSNRDQIISDFVTRKGKEGRTDVN